MWSTGFYIGVVIGVLLLVANYLEKAKRKKENEITIDIRINGGKVQQVPLQNFEAQRPDFVIDNTIDDAGEFYEAEFSPFNARLEFTYTNQKGITVARQVDVKEIAFTQSGGWITGYCHLRKEQRTFRMDRIKECFDLESGEIINDLKDSLERRYLESPYGQYKRVANKHALAIEILIALSKLDGALRAKEKNCIIDFLRLVDDFNEETESILFKELFKGVGAYTIRKFMDRCRKMANSDADQDYKNELIAAAESLVASEKTKHADEIKAVEYLRDKLKSPSIN